MLEPGPGGSSLDEEGTALEATAGTATVPESVEGEPVWWYSVELLGSAAPGLTVVRVTVWQALQPDDPPRYAYSLVRWVRAAAAPAGEEASDWGAGF